MRAFRIAYDGTGYHGFQRQPDVPTVEDAIFDALRELGILSADVPKPSGYAAAGRTDAGVSALAQTVAFECPDWLTPRALDAELPADVGAWASADAPADFHATHDASRREYTYHLYAPSADRRSTDGQAAGSDDSPTGGPLSATIDDDRFRAALEALSGRRDFHNLTPDERGTVRSPTLEASREGEYLIVTVTADGFARELVRRLVSLARSVGTGEEPVGKVARTLSAEPLPGHEGVAPAAPEPLVLTDVEYPDLEFVADERGAERVRTVFGELEVERTTGARVAGCLREGVPR